MFGIGTTEVLVILVVALLVIGPSKLPEVARSLGKGLAEFRRMTSDVKRTFDLESHERDMERGETANGSSGQKNSAPEQEAADDSDAVSPGSKTGEQQAENDQAETIGDSPREQTAAEQDPQDMRKGAAGQKAGADKKDRGPDND